MQSKHSTLLAAIALLLQLQGGTVAAASEVVDLQQRFDKAMAAIEADRLRTARETLRALLAENPSLLRARLELARVYYLQADFAAARAEAGRVLAEPDLPVGVRTTVLAFLAQIDADEARALRRHDWVPSIYAGMLYDTNVNFGPGREFIDIGGLDFVTSAGESDLALVLTPGLSHVYNPGRRFEWGEHTGALLWQSQANAYYRGYFDETDFNLGLLTLRTGPAWVVPRRWRASVALQGDQVWLGDRSLALFTTVNPAVTWNLNDSTDLTLDGAITRRHYWQDEDEGRDGWYRGIGAVLERSLPGGRATLQLGGGYMWFSADDDRFTYDGPDVFAGLLLQAWTNGSVYARVGYRGYDFRDPEPFPFGVARDEDEIRTLLGFQHDYTAGFLAGWSLLGNWAFTTNDSNVILYDYDRHQFSLGLARSF